MFAATPARGIFYLSERSSIDSTRVEFLFAKPKQAVAGGAKIMGDGEHHLLFRQIARSSLADSSSVNYIASSRQDAGRDPSKKNSSLMDPGLLIAGATT